MHTSPVTLLALCTDFLRLCFAHCSVDWTAQRRTLLSCSTSRAPQSPLRRRFSRCVCFTLSEVMMIVQSAVMMCDHCKALHVYAQRPSLNAEGAAVPFETPLFKVCEALQWAHASKKSQKYAPL